MNRRLGRRALGENDGPRNIRDFPVEFAVDEVGDAAKKKSQCGGSRNQITHGKKRDVVPARKQDECEQDSDEATVARHTALPHPQQREGIAENRLGLIEQKITEPPSEHHAKHDVGDEIPNRVAAKGGPPCAMVTIEQPDGSHEAEHVGQPIVANADVIRKSEQKRAKIVNPVGEQHDGSLCSDTPWRIYSARHGGGRKGTCRARAWRA